MTMAGGTAGTQPAVYTQYQDGAVKPIEGAVIEEGWLTVYVNGKELVTLMCTPLAVDELALGYLRSEGLIEKLDDIAGMSIARHQTCADIWLHGPTPELGSHRSITAGCGAGATFDDLRGQRAPLDSPLVLPAGQVLELMRQMHQAADLYREERGVHTSALSDGQQVLLLAQDIGRHNTLDRLWGQALKQGQVTAGHVLLTTGRVSSEMLGKAAKMGAPIIISRSSPTSLSISLAQAWNITVIGYARGSGFRVYSAPQRITY